MNAQRTCLPGLCRQACLLALAVTVAATAAAALYVRFGGPLLRHADNSVSRVLVGEAERMANAGRPDQALERYEKAFQAGFSHPPDKSRALTLKGLLLWRLGRVRDTVDALSGAASGSAPNFTGAPALVEALLRLKRLDEAQSVIRRWRGKLGEDIPAQTKADLLNATGMVAQERGDLEAAKAAWLESAALAPGGPADYRLGMLSAKAGDTVEARKRLQRFLLGGASGNEAAKARELCRTAGLPPPA